MAGQRKQYSSELKTKVALEAIRGHKTANEIAAEYGVHPIQIAQWKKQALDGSSRLCQRAYTDYSLACPCENRQRLDTSCSAGLISAWR
jgi:transposase-like protein